MTKETRTDVQIYSAIAMLLAGVALATAGFIVPPTGEISDSVLLFFAQCLILLLTQLFDNLSVTYCLQH